MALWHHITCILTKPLLRTTVPCSAYQGMGFVGLHANSPWLATNAEG